MVPRTGEEQANGVTMLMGCVDGDLCCELQTKDHAYRLKFESPAILQDMQLLNSGGSLSLSAGGYLLAFVMHGPLALVSLKGERGLLILSSWFRKEEILKIVSALI